MRLWKPLLFSTALLFSAPGCGEDTLTQRQATQAIKNKLAMDKLDWVDALTQRSLRGELSPQQDAALSANINNFIVTDDINPLKDAFERLSNKGDPIFLRFEETLHTDSLALQAVEKGHYTTERDPHAGYNILVTFPKPNSNLSVTKVYNYLPGDDDNDSP